jgi:hypothetical protein
VANAASNIVAYAGNDNGQVGWNVGPTGGGNIFYNNGFIGTIQDAAAENLVQNKRWQLE